MQARFKSTELMSVIVFMLGAFSTVARCQAQAKVTSQSSPQVAADSMWKALSTTCPTQGGRSSSTFFRDGRRGQLLEYRDVRTSVFNWPLNRADELNGIRRKGIAVLRATAYRDYEPSSGWFPWRVVKEVPKDFSEAAYRNDSDHFGYYWPGKRVVLMEERNGRWRFFFEQGYASEPARSDADKKGGSDQLGREGLFDLRDLQGLAPTLSCSDLTSDNQVKPPVPVISRSDWRKLSSYGLFMKMSPEQFQKAPTWKSDHELAAQLEALALGLDDLHIVKSLPPGTRYKVSTIDGKPIVVRSGTVVELEDGRVGLLGPQR